MIARHSDAARRVILVLAAAVVGLVVIQLDSLKFEPATLSGYLVALGVMCGGTIAIVFTVSIFLLQSASDLHSSSQLEVFAYDRREKFIYLAVVIITILLLGGGLVVGAVPTIAWRGSSLIVLCSLVSVGIVFALIDWHYKNVRSKINPYRVIDHLEKAGIRLLRRVQADAQRVAGILEARDNTPGDLTLAATYNAISGPFLSGLDRQVEILSEVALRLADRREVAAAKQALAAIGRVTETLFEVRRSSSLLLPSRMGFLVPESDIQGFLSRVCERLNKVGEKFVARGEDDIPVHLFDVYRRLAAKAADMSFVGGTGENPLFGLTCSYAGLLVETGQRTRNVEVVFQGSRALGDLSRIAVARGLDTSLIGIQDRLAEVARFGLAEHQVVIVDSCTENFLGIIGALFETTRTSREHNLSVALANIAKVLANQASLLRAGILPGDFGWLTSTGKGYDGLVTLLAHMLKLYSELEDEGRRATFRGDVLVLLEKSYRSTRDLAETLKDADSIALGNMGESLFALNQFMIALLDREDFSDESDRLRTQLIRSIHLPAWFAHYANKFDGGSHTFRALADSISRTGILAAGVLNDELLVRECVKAGYATAESCLQKTTSVYGFDEPRAMLEVCYLGILALRRGWGSVVEDVGLHVYEFEAEFVAKYQPRVPRGIDLMNHRVMGLPHHDQLLRELWRWRDDFARYSAVALRDDAGTMLREVIELRDIDRFVYEVWGVWLKGSAFEQEVRLGRARRQLLDLLNRLHSQRTKTP